jgi:hypothetical protein
VASAARSQPTLLGLARRPSLCLRRLKISQRQAKRLQWLDPYHLPLADIPMLNEGSLSCFPAHLFRGINTASIGNARKAVETGIIPRISTARLAVSGSL